MSDLKQQQQQNLVLVCLKYSLSSRPNSKVHKSSILEVAAAYGG